MDIDVQQFVTGLVMLVLAVTVVSYGRREERARRQDKGEG
jgi:hypothetical protein